MIIIIFIAVLGLMLLVSHLALEIGLTNCVIQGAQCTIEIPSQPPEPAGNALSAVWGAMSWVFNAIGSLFQLMTFQVAGLPAQFSLLFLLFTFIILYIAIRLVRGGG